MRAKRPQSTADRLLEYREGWHKHFNALRNPKCKPVMPPPNTFPKEFKTFTDKIYAEELAYHETRKKEQEQYASFRKS